MSKFIYHEEHPTFEYQEDVSRIVEAFIAKGATISELDAELAWSEHSDDYCAVWLGLPDSNEVIIKQIMPYLTVEPESE